jgi:hypothetical protein
MRRVLRFYSGEEEEAGAQEEEDKKAVEGRPR